MKIFFIILFLSSCDYSHPVNINPDIYKIHNQDKSMMLTQGYVEYGYDVRLGRVAENAEVFWSDDKCPYRMGDYAVVYKNKCYYGLMWECDSMYVALSNKDPLRTCGSALVHEFGHCLRGKMGFDPQLPCPGMDASHKDDEFWDIINQAHEESCNRGW